MRGDEWGAGSRVIDRTALLLPVAGGAVGTLCQVSDVFTDAHPSGDTGEQ